MAGETKGPRIGEELNKMQAEPLLPIEKKLIGWSLIIGVALLATLVWTGTASIPSGR